MSASSTSVTFDTKPNTRSNTKIITYANDSITALIAKHANVCRSIAVMFPSSIIVKAAYMIEYDRNTHIAVRISCERFVSSCRVSMATMQATVCIMMKLPCAAPSSIRLQRSTCTIDKKKAVRESKKVTTMTGISVIGISIGP